MKFFTRAARVTAALFVGDTGDRPQFRFALKLTPTAANPKSEFQIDGQSQSYDPHNNLFGVFTWNGRAANLVRVMTTVGGVPRAAQFTGPWALFEFLHQIDPVHWVKSGQAQWTLPWRPPGATGEITIELRLFGDPVFESNYFSGFACPNSFVQ